FGGFEFDYIFVSAQRRRGEMEKKMKKNSMMLAIFIAAAIFILVFDFLRTGRLNEDYLKAIGICIVALGGLLIIKRKG
ncbi:hypothetical protein, partial [uncultured Catenibacterium sp.]|uniref:hypothetical protein n=1 Tax=uncultured Catenibacterium sp. TaxID=286142 RepID=UPI002622BCDD